MDASTSALIFGDSNLEKRESSLFDQVVGDEHYLLHDGGFLLRDEASEAELPAFWDGELLSKCDESQIESYLACLDKPSQREDNSIQGSQSLNDLQTLASADLPGLSSVLDVFDDIGFSKGTPVSGLKNYGAGNSWLPTASNLMLSTSSLSHPDISMLDGDASIDLLEAFHSPNSTLHHSNLTTPLAGSGAQYTDAQFKLASGNDIGNFLEGVDAWDVSPPTGTIHAQLTFPLHRATGAEFVDELLAFPAHSTLLAVTIPPRSPAIFAVAESREVVRRGKTVPKSTAAKGRSETAAMYFSTPPAPAHRGVVHMDDLIRQNDSLRAQVAAAKAARDREEAESGQMLETLNRLMESRVPRVY
ncbi:hypothetical protein HK101_002632 [Irineochytrium annulatum]|nr:hypothetical protein HK101_002632 [Irineochytrium annulatum]